MSSYSQETGVVGQRTVFENYVKFCFIVIYGQLILILGFNTLRIFNVSKKVKNKKSKDISVILPDDYFFATADMSAMNLSVQPFSVVCTSRQSVCSFELAQFRSGQVMCS